MSDDRFWLLSWLKDEMGLLAKVGAAAAVGLIAIAIFGSLLDSNVTDETAVKSVDELAASDKEITTTTQPNSAPEQNASSDFSYEDDLSSAADEEATSNPTCAELEEDAKRAIESTGLTVLEFSAESSMSDKELVFEDGDFKGSCTGTAYTNRGNMLVVYYLTVTPKGQILVETRPISAMF